jgi:5'-3' exonuclease
MKLLIDADSLLYKVCYSSTSLEECYERWDRRIDAIKIYFNSVTGIYEYDTILYIQQKGKTFRNLLYDDYKANRSNIIPPYFKELIEYVKSKYTVCYCSGMESDDLIALHAKDNCIAYIDKDLKQISEAAIHINYNNFTHYNVSKDEARYNFYSQFIIGDSADNIEGIKGLGKRFVEKYFQGGNYFYKTIKLYIKTYGITDGWKKFRKNYTLLRLGNLDHITC